MFRFRRVFPTITFALGALVVCGSPAGAEIRVVATVPDLAAVASEVGRDRVSVRAMSLPTQDPHFVDARPSLALELNRADLVLLVGLDLEIGWLPTLLIGARNPAIQPGMRGYLDCSRFVRPREVPSQPVDRSMGDIHPGGNPHYMMDPRAAAAVAAGIAERLAEIEPSHAATYRANLSDFLQRLEKSRAAWAAEIAPFRGVRIVEYHRTLAYLADCFGLEQFGTIEPKPGIPPTPSHVAQLLVRARAGDVQAIVQEDRYPEATSRWLAGKIPAVLIRIPGGTDFQRGQSYIDYVAGLVRRIAAALAPRRGLA
jgi:zinc/manganese transport system substrate-binding protein